MSNHALYQRDLVSIRDLKLQDIEAILALAERFKKKEVTVSLNNAIIASCFFEASTRTRLSFETAALRLQGKVIGFSNEESLSIKKGETLSDTIRMIASYADLIILRHSLEGAALLAAEIADCPVINAGDGANQHTTQALVDFFTIKECQKKISGLEIGLVGDLKYGRTIHSFIEVCKHFDIRLYLVAPDSLSLPETICDDLKKSGIRFSFHHSLHEVIHKLDILYATRIQAERFTDAMSEIKYSEFTVTPALLSKAKPNLKVLHPLPRVNEIEVACDALPYAYYFEQARNAVPVRQALLSLILNGSPS